MLLSKCHQANMAFNALAIFFSSFQAVKKIKDKETH